MQKWTLNQFGLSLLTPILEAGFILSLPENLPYAQKSKTLQDINTWKKGTGYTNV